MSEVRLYLGDCRDFMRELPDGSFDTIITDPPYNAINRESSGLRCLDKGEADSQPVDIDVISQELIRLASGSIYVWCSDEQYTAWTMAFKEAGLTTRICAWWKTNPSPMNGEHLWLSAIELCVFARKPGASFFENCASPVWRGPTEKVDGHPTPKPLWLMKRLVLASAPYGSMVFDPYMGSGQTGVACMQTGRGFAGCDNNYSYFKIAEKRIGDAQQQPLLPFGADNTQLKAEQIELTL